MSAGRDPQPECECTACQMARDLVQLTSEMLPEMPESPSMARRIWSAIRETAIWAALIGFVVLMVRCGQ